MTACSNAPAEESTEVTDEQEVATDTAGILYNVDSVLSVVKWEGSAISHTHYGTISLGGGNLVVRQGVLTAGSFTIDMLSIKNTNLTDSARNASLVDHLNDTDFFSTKLYPTGRFEITNIALLNNDTTGNTHSISGNLTLRGQTKNVTFPVKANITEDSLTATGTVMVNRLDWGIRYHSTTAFPSLKARLKDNAIRDEFKVSFILRARRR